VKVIVFDPPSPTTVVVGLTVPPKFEVTVMVLPAKQAPVPVMQYGWLALLARHWASFEQLPQALVARLQIGAVLEAVQSTLPRQPTQAPEAAHFGAEASLARQAVSPAAPNWQRAQRPEGAPSQMGIAPGHSLLTVQELPMQVELEEQRAPAAQSELRVQELVQAVAPQMKRPQLVVEVGAQVPAPSQVAARVEMFEGASQEAPRHGVATVG
jgi:hypothetical protein